MYVYIGRRHEDWFKTNLSFRLYLQANMTRLGTWRHSVHEKALPSFSIPVLTRLHDSRFLNAIRRWGLPTVTNNIQLKALDGRLLGRMSF